ATYNANVEATIGSSASLVSRGAVIVDAESSTEANADVEGGGGGVLIGAAGMTSQSMVQGATLADIGNDAVITAGKVAVTAQSQGSVANALTAAGSGGIVSL